MTRPRVTVGVPFFNERTHLMAAVRSVLAQSFEDFQLLLVDDGSTDDSLEIARSFRDPRVTVLSDGERKFLPARLNEIVRRARGAFVARMDADDVVHPSRLAKQLARFEHAPRLDVVGTWAGLVDERGAVLGISESPELPAAPRVAIERGLLVHASILARREWFLARPYDETLTRAEDRDLWCRSVSDSTFGVVQEPLYVVRVSPDSAAFLADYLEAQRQNRRIFLKYGSRMVGPVRTLRLCAESYAKGVVMQAATRVNCTHMLIGRRGRAPRPAELAMLDEALATSRVAGAS